MISLANSPGVL